MRGFLHIDGGPTGMHRQVVRSLPPFEVVAVAARVAAEPAAAGPSRLTVERLSGCVTLLYSGSVARRRSAQGGNRLAGTATMWLAWTSPADRTPSGGDHQLRDAALAEYPWN